MDAVTKRKLIDWLVNSVWWNEIKQDIYAILVGDR